MSVKIPFGQLKFETLDWGCFDSCNTTNEDKLQLLVNKVCETIDLNQVDLKCLSTTRKDNLIDILNLMVTKLCSENQANGTSIDISSIVLCGKDNTSWTYNECLQILNTCFPEITIEAIIQALIKRVNTYSFLISQLKLQLDTLGQQYNTLQIQITQIQTQLNNCC